MRNIALLIEYDGTSYGGWQIQKNSPSIQGTIEKTLSGLLQEKVSVTGAGRTDAGVHAFGQVANFRTASGWKVDRVGYALNGTLPPDIAIRAAADVPDGFHSRFSATARRYSYSVVSGKSAIRRAFAAFFPHDLSLDSMNAAAASLVGSRDFKSFTKYADEQRHFVCNVTKAEWTLVPVGGGSVMGSSQGTRELRFDIQANRFLHGMVRAIVGTLLDVGRGKLTPDEFLEILAARDRSRASMSAPARGLFLEEVSYDFNIWQGGR